MSKKRVTQGRVVKDEPAPQEEKKERKEYSIYMWLFLGIATGILIRIIAGFFTR